MIQKFLEMVKKILSTNPAYKQPGDGSDGTCDCIGLIIGAIRRMGLAWKGIHGSNYAARYETVKLEFISKTSDLELGDVVYKACDSFGVVRYAGGTKSHKYELPDRYKKGKSYYNGDLLDYYHAGVVTSVKPLQITHMTSPSAKVDTNLTGGWNYHGKAKPVWNAMEKQPEMAPTEPVTTPVNVESGEVPKAGCEAIVTAENGYPVKMREYPNTSCRTWIKLPVGTKVTIIQPGEKWAKIDGWGRHGWYMMAQFLDVVGDGQGKY